MTARAPGRRQILTRLSGFTLSVIAVSLVGITTIPILTLAVGDAQWGHIALTQTTVQFAAVFVAFGWGTTGPTLVAAMAARERADYFRDSLRTRAKLFAIAVPVTATLLTLLLRGDVAIALLGTIAYLLPALGGSWYFTGTARPSRLFLLDTVPTLSGTVTGLVVVSLTQTTWTFLLCQALGSLTGVILSALVILRSAEADRRARRPRFFALLGDQRHAVTTAATSSFYVSLPMIAIGAFAPTLVPIWGLADRLFRYAAVAFLPIQQFLQGWVPEVKDRIPYRMRAATAAGAGIAVLGGLAVAVLSPLVSPLFSSGKIHVPWEVSSLLGLAFVGIGTSAVVGYACLIVIGRERALAHSTVLGAVVGAPLVIWGASIGSLVLVAAAVAVTELCVAAYQVVVLSRALPSYEAQNHPQSSA